MNVRLSLSSSPMPASDKMLTSPPAWSVTSPGASIVPWPITVMRPPRSEAASIVSASVVVLCSTSTPAFMRTSLPDTILPPTTSCVPAFSSSSPSVALSVFSTPSIVIVGATRWISASVWMIASCSGGCTCLPASTMDWRATIVTLAPVPVV